MAHTILNSMVAAVLATAGLVGGYASAGNKNHTMHSDLPPITVYADRIDVTQAGDIADLLVVADRFHAAEAHAELTYGVSTADLPDMTVSVPRVSQSEDVRVAGAKSGRNAS